MTVAPAVSSRRCPFLPHPSQTDVNGPGQSPLWAYLKNKQGGLLGSDIKWNCELGRWGEGRWGEAQLLTLVARGAEVRIEGTVWRVSRSRAC